MASCLLPGSSTRASPRSKAPKASWQENLANEFPAEQSAARVENGPDSKQANDWQPREEPRNAAPTSSPSHPNSLRTKRIKEYLTC